MTVGPDAPFDWVVSTFVPHYVDFDGRVDFTSFFVGMAPKVLYVTWGDQSKVGFLRAIKTFATWKGSLGAKGILDTKADIEDDRKVASPRGSFTMSRKATFQGIVDKIDGVTISSFETKNLLVRFPNVRALLSFLPFPSDDQDCEAMLKLLRHWGSTQKEQVIFGGDGKERLDPPLGIPNTCQVLLPRSVRRRQR